MESQLTKPGRDESAPYYDTYTRHVPEGYVLKLLEAQLGLTMDSLRAISEERSLYRYAEGKWSIRQLLNHVTDTERVMLFRAYWFARNFNSPLPGMDQDVAAAAAAADDISWESHVDEFRTVREASLSFFRNLPADAWLRRGTADGNPFTVRALARIIYGHAAHHEAILRERYLIAG